MDFFGYSDISSDLMLLQHDFDELITLFTDMATSNVLLQPTIDIIQKKATEVDLQYSTVMGKVLKFYNDIREFLSKPLVLATGHADYSDKFQYKTLADLNDVGMKDKENWVEIELIEEGNKPPFDLTVGDTCKITSQLITFDCGSAVATLSSAIEELKHQVELMKTATINMLEYYSHESEYYSSTAMRYVLDKSNFIAENWSSEKVSIEIALHNEMDFIEWTIANIGVMYKAIVGVKVNITFIDKLYEKIDKYTPEV